VLGFQGRSQLDKRYGQDAEAMLSQPATKIFFKTSEPRAAKWISEAIGEVEVERLKESRSMDLMSMRSSKSYAMEIAVKPLVMASEISGLEPLRAFIKQENRVVPVWFRLTPKCSKQPEFVERKMLAIAAKPVEARTAAPTPPKKPAESVPSSEARLPFDAPAAKSEDDDERKGSGRNKNNEETDKDKTIRTGAVRPKKASFGTSPRASTRAQKPQATSQRLGGRDEKPRSGVKSRGSDFPVGRGIPILSGRETANGSPRGIDSALLAVKFNSRPPLL
jgi:hypothetical protein